MAFTVTDFQDLMTLLGQHPEWQAELRRVLVGDQLVAIDARLEALVAAQERTEASLEALTRRVDALGGRMDQLAERMDQLAERMDQLAERMDQLAERMDQLAERMDQLTERMDQLAERMNQLAERMNQLTQRVDQLTERLDQFAADTASRLQIIDAHVGSLRGWQIEYRLERRVPGYFGAILRKPRPVSPFELAAVELAHDEGRLSDEEWRSLGALDILVEGGRIEEPSYLAIEASAVVDRTDVQRASDRATILRGLGLVVTPWVAGESILQNASDLADQLGVEKLVAPGLAS